MRKLPVNAVKLGKTYVINGLSDKVVLERSQRVNKLNNIITKDITLNGMGDAKRATATEYEAELARTKELIHKQKTHWFS